MGISPSAKTQQITILAQSIVLRTTPPPLELNQASSNAYQMIALFLQSLINGIILLIILFFWMNSNTIKT